MSLEIIVDVVQVLPDIPEYIFKKAFFFFNPKISDFFNIMLISLLLRVHHWCKWE